MYLTFIKGKNSLRQQTLSTTATYRDRIICAQAHWFIYSSTSPTLEIFRDKYFKAMLMSVIPPTNNHPKNIVLSIPMLKLVIAAEWECFVHVLKNLIRKKSLEAQGNTFCQFIHDGCTLGNKSKYQAFGIQFVDSRYYNNHVVALTFERVLTSNAQSVADLAKLVVKDITGFDFGNLCGCSVQDSAAKSVARHLELEEETCDMHDSDKIGRSAIGELLRKDGRGGVVNPFDAGKFFCSICCNDNSVFSLFEALFKMTLFISS